MKIGSNFYGASFDGKEMSGLVAGEFNYRNSVRDLTRPLDPTKLGFATTDPGFGSGLVFADGRSTMTRLRMPTNCLNLGPHCHPGGEVSIVLGGSYFDADIDGNQLLEYPEGSVVVYSKWSTHRPLSRTGADIIYFTLDGIIIPNKGVMAPEVPRKVIDKMVSLKAPKDAVAFALEWLVPEKNERERILESLVAN
ncbi:MAG TPA: hypothetical protein VJB87_02700 [Candidatus Nanoarchaeia archaeon]|nr:hypothetical protein [Candidatus Nanoarchaeia archaeon]